MRLLTFFLLLCMCCCLPNWVSAQAPGSRGIFLELGGTGGLGSFNYEKGFRRWGSMDLLLRVGISGFPVDPNNGNGIVVPTLVEGLLGETAHKLEVGFGHALTLTTRGRLFTNLTPVIGYRWQPDDRRIFLRASYTPIVSYLLDFQYQHWAGISIGYTLQPKQQ